MTGKIFIWPPRPTEKFRLPRLDEEQQSAVEGEKKPLPFMTVDGQQ
jgi:hypothetical protein